ncbi:MAG: AraC family transcriptional regulator [Sphaerochaetaceae bacterium]|nr:AraC family transcriptional regulator [Sphaerochaetaceae bacterium]MDD4218790.1 AraC family transcriptional regulator [Sphaerochaetaceae bacterium]MDY0371063.1 AraC family transcriptional regulator [Sphaerochaetaceae bacterium]
MINFDFISTGNRKIINFQEIDINGMILLGKYNYTYSSPKKNVEVFENYIEIIYLEKGFQYYFVDNKKYLIEGGDVLIILPNEEHYPINLHENRGRLYWLIIDISKRDNLLSFNPSTSRLLLKTIMENSKDDRKKIKLHAKTQLENIFKIHSQTPKDALHRFIQKIEIEFEIAQLLLNIIQTQMNIFDLKNNYSHRIKKCITYINDNIFTENISIDTLAEISNLSSAYFIKTFKKEVGLPPNDYINKIKIDIAKEKIQNDSPSITYLAYELGFSSSQYFSRVFKKYVGNTPSEYKKQIELNKTDS